jgi:hypothetical protein
MRELLFEGYYSDFLFARPSLIGGIAKLLDFGGTLKIYNESLSEELADLNATSQDWKAIGSALRTAFKEYQAQNVK